MNQIDQIRPGQLFPSRGSVSSIIQWLNSTGRSGGAGIRNTPMGLSGPPQNPSWIYVEITDNDDPENTGLHGFQQIEFVQLDDGEWTTGTTGAYGSIENNPLKELNHRKIPVGEVVRAELGPGDRCWVCVWGGESSDQGEGSGSGSGSGTGIPAYCDGQLAGHISVDGDSVSFTSIT